MGILEASVGTNAIAVAQALTISVAKDKGGVGGSLVAQGTAEVFRYRGGKEFTVAVLDGDATTHTTMSRLGERDAQGDFLEQQSIAGGVVGFDLTDRDQAGTVIDIAELQVPLIVMDTPAGGLARFATLTENLNGRDVVQAHQSQGRKVAIFVPITPMLASVGNVRAAMDCFGDDVHYVVVRNLYGCDSSSFTLWDERDFRDAWGRVVSGSSKERLLAAGGRIIDLPALNAGVVAKMDALGLSAVASRAHERFSLSQRIAITNWLRAWARELDKVGDVLGLTGSLAEGW